MGGDGAWAFDGMIWRQDDFFEGESGAGLMAAWG